MSRGLRNSNPGNIRISQTKYLGEVQPSADREFKQFENAQWGYRAIFVLLRTYSLKHGCDTVRKIINRYAPPVENHTDKYISAVCDWTGLGPDQKLDTMDRATMIPLVEAISRMENGRAAVSQDVAGGWDLFIKHKP